MIDLFALQDAMIRYNTGDPARIQHFLKVWAFARAIAAEENLSQEERQLIEAAALVHDIGIRRSEEKYGSAAGNYQEIEGPPEARRMLSDLGASRELTDRVCFLVGHHHTYQGIDGTDWQILVEADFLVNLFEGASSAEAIASAREKIFRTRAGLRLLDLQFPPKAPAV